MKFLINKCLTIGSLLKFFVTRKRALFIPLLLLLLLLALVLMFTASLSAVAPFVYTLF